MGDSGPVTEPAGGRRLPFASGAGAIMTVAISVAIMCIGVPIGLLLYQSFSPPPPPLYYPNPIAEVQVRMLHAGDPLPLIVTRCATDDGGTGMGRLPFWYTATIVNAVTGESTDIIGGFGQAVVGCNTTNSQLLRIPTTLTPGRYFARGSSTAAGVRRAATVGWSTQEFEVVAR